MTKSPVISSAVSSRSSVVSMSGKSASRSFTSTVLIIRSQKINSEKSEKRMC